MEKRITMNITVVEVKSLEAIDAAYIAGHLCRDGSVFQKALRNGAASGDIAFCRDQGEIIGWSRTERWEGYPTLESFVIAPYRGRGVATACAQALIAGGALARSALVAVFRPQMDVIARRCGLRTAQFSRKGDRWTRTLPTHAFASARPSPR